MPFDPAAERRIEKMSKTMSEILFRVHCICKTGGRLRVLKAVLGQLEAPNRSEPFRKHLRFYSCSRCPRLGRTRTRLAKTKMEGKQHTSQFSAHAKSKEVHKGRCGPKEGASRTKTYYYREPGRGGN